MKVTQPPPDSDDDMPLADTIKPLAKVVKPKVSKQKSVKHESDSDVPLARAKSKPFKRAKAESDSDDEVPLATKSKKPKVKTESPSTNGVKKTSVKNESVPPKKKPVKEEVKDEDEDEEEEEEYKWWEGGHNDGTKKWTSLEHNGVLFPPPYEPLPKHVKMKYDGRSVDLPLEAEEVAGFFAALIESDHGQNPVFQQNFFDDWLKVLKDCNAVLSLCPVFTVECTNGVGSVY
jgi:DNA topoisomerase I